MPRPPKHSHPLMNLANVVEEHVTHTWPEIACAAPANLWFTGSHIWHFLYPDRPPPLVRDWDIFTIGVAPARWIVEVYGWNHTPSCHTNDKWGVSPRIIDVSHIPTIPGSVSASGYGDGYSYQTDRGIVDLWISEFDNPLAELRAYPTASHAHCRAAWSFTEGLIVLPNERARESQTSGPEL
jgi:hypothetical protein